MKWVLYIIGVLLFLMGSVWILQGLGLYPVGGMANQIKWTYAGIVVDLVGIGLIVLARRRRNNLPPSSKGLIHALIKWEWQRFALATPIFCLFSAELFLQIIPQKIAIRMDTQPRGDECPGRLATPR